MRISKIICSISAIGTFLGLSALAAKPIYHMRASPSPIHPNSDPVSGPGFGGVGSGLAIGMEPYFMAGYPAAN